MNYHVYLPFKKIMINGNSILVAVLMIVSSIGLFAQPVRMEKSAIDSLKNIIKGPDCGYK